MSETKEKYLIVSKIPVQEITAQERRDRIRCELRNAANSYLNVGFDLRAAKQAQEWKPLGLANFGEYCASLDIGESWASDVARLADYAELFPAYRERMLDIGVSKMRLLLPHLPAEPDEAQFDTVIDMASEASWNDLRKELNPSRPPEAVFDLCPHCNGRLHLSRAAQLTKA